MDKQLILNKLRQIKATADRLSAECYNTIQMLEADSSASSTRKGFLDDLGARAVVERDRRMAIKAVKNNKQP